MSSNKVGVCLMNDIMENAVMEAAPTFGINATPW